MKLRISVERKVLTFRKPAGTSRGVYLDHYVWYVRIHSDEMPDRIGIGECAPLPDLSCDASDDYEFRLKALCSDIEKADGILTDGFDFLDANFWEHAGDNLFSLKSLINYPSVLFGLETALREFQQSSKVLWESDFVLGKDGILINGLIWMGPVDEMRKQILSKINAGFTCIKLKIGALDFDEELALLDRIRQDFPADRITLRVDANGAFSPEDAPGRLARLAKLGLHSIEQPIKAGQRKIMADLIRSTPVPIALDEELIGVHHLAEKRSLLQELKPHYLVLKPTLHGGISGCSDWIRLASSRGIGWWITSALESNIGLNAIAQWSATLNTSMHQGLGTGLLYINNVESPLYIEGEKLWYKADKRIL
jgi:o-succinylbenzoate synthase